MTYQNIVVETRERTGLIRLNRPERMNALNDALAVELKDALERFDADDAVAVIGIEPVERLLQLDGERVVQRVHSLRPVEPDETDALARLDDDVLIGHGFAFQLST